MPTPTTSLAVSFAPVSTGNYVADSLTSGSSFWGTGFGGAPGAAVTVTYSFASPQSAWAGSYSAANEPSTVSALSAAQQGRFEDALEAWSSVSGIEFVRVEETASSVGDIRVGYSDNLADSAYAWAYYPGGPVGGDIWLNDDFPALLGSDFAPGSYEYLTLMHELGHALGLSHPDGHAYALNAGDDLSRNTIMSHTHVAGYDASGLLFYPTTLMAYDIAAMQYLYGADTSYRAGDDIYVFDEGANYLQTIWDAGGNDTIVYNSATDGAAIDLAPGAWSNLGADITAYYYDPDGRFVSFGDNVNIYGTVVIENAQGGSGADSITGNSAANRLAGNGGDDFLDGRGGSDTLDGGAGDDIYVVDAAGDLVIETGGGADTVKAQVSEVLAGGIEYLVLTGTGAINGTGNALANTLTGNGARNVLDGKGNADTLKGQGGNDVLAWDPADTYDGGGGTDTLRVAGGNLNLLEIANSRIRNVEQIDIRGGGNNGLTLNLSDLLDISSSTNTLKVLGNAGDWVDISGSFSSQGVASGFRTYKVGTGTLLIDTDITVV